MSGIVASVRKTEENKVKHNYCYCTAYNKTVYRQRQRRVRKPLAGLVNEDPLENNVA